MLHFHARNVCTQKSPLIIKDYLIFRNFVQQIELVKNKYSATFLLDGLSKVWVRLHRKVKVNVYVVKFEYSNIYVNT